MIDLRQRELNEWQERNFGEQSTERLALGMAEEVGELCHLVLKRAQGIREGANGDDLRADMADAFGDMIIYGIQMMSNESMDAEGFLELTIAQVLLRDWKKFPKNGETE